MSSVLLMMEVLGPEVLQVELPQQLLLQFWPLSMKIPSRCQTRFLTLVLTGVQVLVRLESSAHQGSVRLLVLVEEPLEPEEVGEQPGQEHLAKSVQVHLGEVRQLACGQPLVPLQLWEFLLSPRICCRCDLG